MLELKERLLDRHRHPQHAAGRARVGLTAFFTVELDDDGKHRIGAVVEYDDDGQDLLQPGRQAHGGLRHRQVRLAWPSRPPGSTSSRSSQALEAQALGGARPRRRRARPRARGARTTRTSSSRRSSSPTTTGSTAATSRSTRAILSLLALQAPVAGDLRIVAALLHVIKHVERMGDQCVNIAKLIPLSGHEPPVDDEMLEMIAADGPARALGGRAGQAGVRAARRRPGRGPRAPGRARSTASTASASSARWRSGPTRTAASGRCT